MNSLLGLLFFLICITLLHPAHSGSQGVATAPLVLPVEYEYSNHESHATRRRLLRKGDALVSGDLQAFGYFYTYISFGTPPQKFKLAIDTGSAITHVPCSTCTSCARRKAVYNRRASKTVIGFSCAKDYCRWQTCDRYDRCIFDEVYGGGSSISGVYLSDVITFSDHPFSLNRKRVTFGCRDGESGIYSQQDADGMLGLGRGSIGIMNQLADAGAMREIFALCFRGLESGNGVIVLGEFFVPPGTSFTGYDLYSGESIYKIYISKITVSGRDIGFSGAKLNKGYGVVIDTGTTYTFFPRDIFHNLVYFVQENIGKRYSKVNGPDSLLQYNCYSNFSDVSSDLADYFPEVEFQFWDSGVFKLTPDNYLFKHPRAAGVYCLSFFENGESGITLGASAFGNVLLMFDQVNHRIGFQRTACSNLSVSLGYPGPPAPPQIPSPPPPSPPQFPPPEAPLPVISPEPPEPPMSNWPPAVGVPPEANSFDNSLFPSFSDYSNLPSDDSNISQILSSLPSSVTQGSGLVLNQTDGSQTQLAETPLGSAPAVPPAVGSANSFFQSWRNSPWAVPLPVLLLICTVLHICF